jgi:hypothetical protein
MLFKAEGGKVNAISENSRLSQDTHTSDAVNLHFHVRVAVWISEVGEMRAPGSIFGVPLDNDCIFI